MRSVIPLGVEIGRKREHLGRAELDAKRAPLTPLGVDADVAFCHSAISQPPRHTARTVPKELRSGNPNVAERGARERPGGRSWASRRCSPSPSYRTAPVGSTQLGPSVLPASGLHEGAVPGGLQARKSRFSSSRGRLSSCVSAAAVRRSSLPEDARRPCRRARWNIQ